MTNRQRRPFNFAPQPIACERVGGRLDPDQSSFLKWLFARGGLDASVYRDETLLRRLSACLRTLRARTLREARAALEKNPRKFPAALESMIIGVTNFFRDRSVFEMLQAKVLPLLASRVTVLRIWSAGCSDGQELYSVGMLLAEMNCLNRAYLLGTDCRSAAVRRASLGIYLSDDVRALPRELLGRYFFEEQSAWRMCAFMRTAVQWRTADVLCVDEPGAWDVILCRNLAMYLNQDATRSLWQRLYRALRPGGVLVLGKAERPVGVPLSVVSPCIFRRDRG